MIIVDLLKKLKCTGHKWDVYLEISDWWNYPKKSQGSEFLSSRSKLMMVIQTNSIRWSERIKFNLASKNKWKAAIKNWL